MLGLGSHLLEDLGVGHRRLLELGVGFHLLGLGFDLSKRRGKVARKKGCL